MSGRSDKYEAVIGLEVHAQLSTRSKMFCACATAFGAAPNTQVCPVCLGLPGALPVVNRTAVEYAIRMGLATHCAIAEESVFARKNYFYPDCPKNYQISQYDRPLCTGGYVTIGDGTRKIGIRRIHLEEDAGKLVHAEAADYSLVDMNRCGVPLIEIVSEPDMRTAREARECMQKLRALVRYLDICDGNMEEGSLRCDVNVSERPRGAAAFGTSTEIKNVNSFKFVEQAIEFEIERQERILDAGGRVEHATLMWDAQRGEAHLMRTKEEAHDYRYFPEPDLRVLRTPRAMVEAVAASVPELPDDRRERLVVAYGLPAYDAGVLTAQREIADYFETVAAHAGDAKAASNWVMGEVLRELNERALDITAFPVAPGDLAELIRTLSGGAINAPTAKDVFREMASSGRKPSDIISEKGLLQIRDEDMIREAAARVIEENPDALAKYLRGKEKLLQFFIGALMKATRGKASPELAGRILKELLNRRRGR
jgi:aspartyl-tRNA(Asn)/glutamyl-tRNA(Gln) amidotransferase subunit B